MLNYNEKKVGKGEAQRLYAGNFLVDASMLARLDIKQRLENNMELNQRVEKKATHIVLSFPAGEKLDDRQMSRIAIDYMDHIGFGRQPFVVYRHLDTASPHVHIITTNIRPDGSHIHRRRFGGWHLLPFRRAMEQKYGLLDSTINRAHLRASVNAGESLQYGKLPTTEAIANAMEHVLQEYQFRSISELNAILRLFNIIIRPGRPGTRVYETGGLLYQALGDDGKGRGMPVKASKLKGQPTLKRLERKFAEYRRLDVGALRRVEVAFGEAVREGIGSSGRFHDALRRRQLAAAPETDEWGKTKGLLVVDLAAKTVVKAEEMGFDLEGVKVKLGYDPLQNTQTILAPGHTIRNGRGYKR